MFHGRHFVRHLETCNPICVKLLQVMSGIILGNIKTTSLSETVFPRSTNAAHTHTNTHTHTHKHTHPHTHARTHKFTHKYTHRHTYTTIAIGEMQCINTYRKTCACETLLWLWMLSIAFVANLRYNEPKRQLSNVEVSNPLVHLYGMHDIRDSCLSFNQFWNELKTLLYGEAYLL